MTESIPLSLEIVDFIGTCKRIDRQIDEDISKPICKNSVNAIFKK